MRHVADGDLHAYLDGGIELLPAHEAERIREHLDRCDACRARLDEARALRDRAGAILGLADPGELEAPPFEELRRRARGAGAVGGAAATGGLSRMGALRVAAVAVVALGVGWMAGRVGPERSAPALSELSAGASSEALHEAPRAVDAGSAERRAIEAERALGRSGPGSGSRVAQADGDGEGAAVSPAPAAAEPTRRALVDAGTESPIARPSAPVQAAALPEVAEKPEAAAEGTAAARQRTASAPPPVEPRTRTPAALAADLKRAADSLALPQKTFPPREEPVSPTVALTGDSARGTIQATAKADEIRPLHRVQTGDESAATPAERVMYRRRESAAEGAASAGLPLRSSPAFPPRQVPGEPDGRRLAVPGLTVVSVEWTEVAPGIDGLRVVQRLVTGDTIELRFGGLDGGVPLPEYLLRESLPEGTHQVVVDFERGWLVARAPLDEDQIRALVALIS